MKTPLYSQSPRPLEVTTPLGKDALLLVGFQGREAISEPFQFQLDLLAENRRDVPFEQVLGQTITVRLALGGGRHRHFSGVVSRFSQGSRDHTFTRYRAEVVPQFWLLRNRFQSRIFQHQAVPDILKAVLDGLDTRFEIRGDFHPRPYCVQYRETDFAFASRLMEEEGIYYFFEHRDGGHRLVVANTPAGHPALPEGETAIFDASQGEQKVDVRVDEWEKVQAVRPAKVTLWDHHFELPDRNLEATRAAQAAVAVGRVTHPLTPAGAEAGEVYEYPGGHARRFDGIDRGGGDRPADLARVFEDGPRTAAVRAQQEAAAGLEIHAAGTYRTFTAGHRFALRRHFNADGDYVLTAVDHWCELGGDFRSGHGGGLDYRNRFTCIPLGLPFRPARATPRPRVEGAQTATVVGVAGTEIYTDKYGRVKVQFPWDRQGRHDADSSCWVRVAQPLAGKRWGASFWPRVGQEVVVDFLEGDPDRPIIVGSVYNAEQMPPYLGGGPDPLHPHDAALSGIKTCSTPGGEGFNELRFDDTKGREQVFLHAQKDLEIRAGNTIKINTMGNCLHLTTGCARDGQPPQGDIYLQCHKDANVSIQGEARSAIQGTESRRVQGDGFAIYEGSRRTAVGIEDLLEAPIVIVKASEICLRTNGGFITLNDEGVTIVGQMVKINSGGAPLDTSAAGVGADGKPTPIDKQVKAPVLPQAATTGRSGGPSVRPAKQGSGRR